MRLTFLGANRQVTGSRYLLEANGSRILIDCGLFQERDYQARNWDAPPFDPAAIDSLLLTHAHLDHCGLLPRLVQQGLGGPIITTAPTVELAQVVMDDSARIQREDVKQKQKRHRRQRKKGKHPYVPLYTTDDAKAVRPLMKPVKYGEPIPLPGADGTITACFREAGHILGSAMIEITISDPDDGDRRLVLSGDIGQWDVPIVGDPTLLERADWIVMESTYGDRDHERNQEIDDQLEEVINETVRRGGNVIIPTFAIECAEELMLHLEDLVHTKRIPRLPTFLDSPMAVNVTEIFRRHRSYMDEQTLALVESGRLEKVWDWLNLVRNRDDSKAINGMREPCVIMAGSGMCTGGRVKHHLAHNVGRPESTILFVGYQAHGTLGRAIVDGAEAVRIFGGMHPMNAQVRQVQGLSAHAGRADLLRWLEHFVEPPRKLMLTHGEEETSLALAKEIRNQMGWDVSVPEYRETIEL